MPHWKPSVSDILKTLAYHIQRRYDGLRTLIKRTLGLVAPVKILPYHGFGTEQKLFLMGRVLEDKAIGSPRKEDRWWRNALAMYRRFATDVFPNVRVRATVLDQTLETTTDEEGYFRVEMNLSQPLASADSWTTIDLELLDEVCQGQGPVRASGKVLVPAASSRFGVISDVDDTIIHSNATDFLKMARITFLNNALTRTPLPGVSRFYRALEQSGSGDSGNPFFYVSSSAWNMYDLLEQFLHLHNIPAGPILLRDLGSDDKQLIKSGHEHKYEKIERIMQTFPDLPFVLIGDAGQDDPVIYREIVRRNPDRVAAIYIRTVGREVRNERARRLASESGNADVPMRLVDNAEEALEHAAAIGLVV